MIDDKEYYKGLEYRISELEKTNKEIANGQDEMWEHFKIEIAELREYIRINSSNIQDNIKGFKDFRFLQGSQMKRSDHLQDQLNELKEFDKGCQKWSMNIEEVLREFMVVSEYWLSQKEEAKVKKLLEKLDGVGSARQTEKKEHDYPDASCEQIPLTTDTIEDYRKREDSGGEKEVGDIERCNHSRKKPDHKGLPDSKPPEPIFCNECEKVIMPLSGFKLVPIEERVRDATRQEPRENDEPLKKMVRIKNKQLKKHYSGKEEHLVCLTCEAIVSKKLISEFVEDLKFINKESDTYFYDILKKWEDKLK